MTFKSRFGPPRQLTITRIGWFYVLLTVGMGAAGINTGNNLVMLICGMMLGLIVASGVLSERCLRDLEVGRELPAQLSVGADSLVTLVLRNVKRSASFGVLVSETALPGRSQFPLVRGAETERRGYLITPTQRGTLRFAGLRLATRFPFGLFEKSLVIDRPQEALVAPKAIPTALPAGSPQTGTGEHSSPGEGLGLDPWELRLHREGEDIRRIAWAQSARAGKLLSLTREREGLSRALLRLHSGLTPAARERHLGELRYQAETLLGEGTAVALTTGPTGETTLVPSGVGAPQLSRILRLLASEPGAETSTATARQAEVASAPSAAAGTPRFLIWQRAAIFVCAAAAFASVAVSGELSTWLLAAFGLTWLYALIGRERGSASFAQAVNLLSLALLAVLVGTAFTKTQSIPVSASQAALLLCANRLMVRRDPGDDSLLHLSCFLLLAAGAALGTGLQYGLCLSAFCCIAALSLTLTELRRGIEEDARAQASSLMAARELTAPNLLWSTAALGLAALAFGVALFPLFPRAQLGLLQGFGSGGPRTTGVSDRVDLTAGGELHPSSKAVLRAELTSGSPEALHYLRVVTLDQFNGKGWLPPDRRGVQLHMVSVDHPPVASGTLEPLVGQGDFIPVPEGLTDLRPDSFGVALRMDDQGDLRLVSSPGGPLTLRFATAQERPQISASPRDRDLELPELPPALLALGRKLIPDGLAPAEAGRRVERYLRGAFSYTREPEGGAAPLETFLRDRRGDCQLFATVTAVLLRSRGIPARYVAGYYLDNPKLGGNVVRAWDAHAWAEVLTPDGALLLDATPPTERGGHGAHETLWQSILDLGEAAQFRWLRSVVDYDSHAQMKQAQWLAKVGRVLWQSPKPGKLPASPILIGLALAALGVLISWRLGRSRRDPAGALELRLFARLAKLGLARGPSTTYDEALGQLRARSPALAERATTLLRRLGEARFGARPLSTAERGTLARAIDRLGLEGR